MRTSQNCQNKFPDAQASPTIPLFQTTKNAQKVLKANELKSNLMINSRGEEEEKYMPTQKKGETKQEQFRPTPTPIGSVPLISGQQSIKMPHLGHSKPIVSSRKIVIPSSNGILGCKNAETAIKSRKDKVDPRALSLKQLLDACCKKKVGETNLNYRLLPGILGNEQQFAVSFIADSLTGKNFKTCLITPIDHRILSTLLTDQFPKQYEQKAQLHYNLPSQQLNNCYEKIYNMEQVIFYKYYLELQEHFNRKSISRIRAKYDQVIRKKVNWRQFGHIKRDIDKLLKKIQDKNKSEELLAELEDEIDIVKKKRKTEVNQIKDQLLPVNSIAGKKASRVGMKIGGNKVNEQLVKKMKQKIRNNQSKRTIKKSETQPQKSRPLNKNVRVQIIDEREQSSCEDQNRNHRHRRRRNSSSDCLSSSNSLSGSQIFQKKCSYSISQSDLDSDLERQGNEGMSQTPKRLKDPDERSINQSLQSVEQDSYLDDLEPQPQDRESDGQLQEGYGFQNSNKSSSDRWQSNQISGFSDSK